MHVLLLLQAVIAQPAVDTSQLATTAQLATVEARVCPAGTVAPKSEAVQAAAGTASTCLRSDATLPRITRAGMTTTDSNGGWAITWQTAMPAAPVTLPLPLNSGTQPIVCNVSSTTATGAAGRCWLARTLPATILSLTALVSFDPNGAPAANLQVQVLAIPTTQ